MKKILVCAAGLLLGFQLYSQNPDLASKINSLIEKQEYPAALKIAEEELSKSDASAYNWFFLGKVKQRMRDTDGAFEAYEKVESIDNGIAELYLQRGILYYVTGSYDKSLNDLNRAVELDAKQHLNYYNRALALIELNDPDAAIKDLNKTIELNPKKADAYLQRAIINFEDENFKECVRDCSKAIELNPNLADAYFYRAIARGGDKQDKAAIEDFNKAIELNPNHDEALTYRGSAKLLSGNKKGACLDWKKAMDLGNDTAEQNYYTYCQ